MANEGTQSVQRAFRILEYLLTATKPRTLKEIATDCNLSPATAFRLLSDLCAVEYVQHEKQGTYSVSTRLQDLVAFSSGYESITQLVYPYLQDLSDRVGETVFMVVLDRNSLLYVANCVKSIGSFRFNAAVGNRGALHSNACGKAILSTMPDDMLNRVLNSIELTPITEHTITDRDEFMKEIETVRQTGYAWNREENEYYNTAIAVPIVFMRKPAFYAISVSTLSVRMTPEHANHIIENLLYTKQRIENSGILTAVSHNY